MFWTYIARPWYHNIYVWSQLTSRLGFNDLQLTCMSRVSAGDKEQKRFWQQFDYVTEGRRTAVAEVFHNIGIGMERASSRLRGRLESALWSSDDDYNENSSEVGEQESDCMDLVGQQIQIDWIVLSEASTHTPKASRSRLVILLRHRTCKLAYWNCLASTSTQSLRAAEGCAD